MKKWVMGFLACWLGLLTVVGGLTAVVDPYFHYHGPLPFLQYYFDTDSQRYVNNGILRHFDYDAIIIGSSMTENFRASELDRLMGAHTVKVPFRDGSYKEIGDHTAKALRYNPKLKLVVRCLDYAKLLDAPDAMREDADSYPTYLYDDNPFNDVKYLFNKTIFLESTLHTLTYTAQGNTTTDFDSYSNWMHRYTFGREGIDSEYTRLEKPKKKLSITQEDYELIAKTIAQNVTAQAEQYPDTQFYLFFPPYSIFYWDRMMMDGNLERLLQAEHYAISLMLPYENIHLFSFTDEFEMICNADLYKDTSHYNADVNSRMLEWMSAGEHRLTQENYQEYCRRVDDFLLGYDYDTLFE